MLRTASLLTQGLCMILAMFVLAACMSKPLSNNNNITKPDQTPELSEIQDITNLDQAPSGVIFVIREFDESALSWITPRLLYYASLLRERFPDLSIAVLSHGDEILALTTENRSNYPDTHADIETLVQRLFVSFHICGAYASDNGLSDQDFPGYVDVVPYGPTQIADYLSLGYVLINLELTW